MNAGLTAAKPIVHTVRAVAAEFARRTVKPFMIIGACVAGGLIALGIWLVNISVWWWFLLVPVILWSLIGLIVAIVVQVIVNVVDAAQSKEQKQAVKAYVKQLQEVSEDIHAPQFVILFRVVRDVVRPRPDGFIARISQNSKTLAPGFVQLVKLF